MCHCKASELTESPFLLASLAVDEFILFTLFVGRSLAIKCVSRLTDRRLNISNVIVDKHIQHSSVLSIYEMNENVCELSYE